MNTLSIILIIVSAILCIALCIFIAKVIQKEKAKNVLAGKFNETIDNLKSSIENQQQKNIEISEELETTKNDLAKANANAKDLEVELNYLKKENEITEGAKDVSEKLVLVKKALRKANDNIEDLEDELDEQKRKTKRIEAEKDEHIDLLERKNKQINAELTEKANELKEINKQNSLMSESLSFVQEVMNAKPANNKSYFDKIKKIDEIYNYIKDDLAPFLEPSLKGTIFEDDIFGSQLNEWREITSKHWILGKVKIALVGEFSAGKTSIVNRLLSLNDPNFQKLPVCTKATTAIPTYISGGATTSYCFYTPDNKLKNISRETFNKVTKDVLDKVQGVSSLIKYFVMTYKNPNLDGMSILDTPGFNSTDSEDATRTLGVINECDALFWVVDVNTGTVNRSSLNLMKKELKKPFYVIINKVDTKEISEVEKTEKNIKETFEKENLHPLKFIRFSQDCDINPLVNVVKSIPRDTHPEDYAQNLKKFLDDSIEILKEDFFEKNNAFSSARKGVEDLTESFNSSLHSISKKCAEAQDIPHWKTYWFKKNRYEMSKREGAIFQKLLEDINIEKAQEIKKTFYENSDASKQVQKTYEEMKDSQVSLNEMIQHQQKINRLFNELNNL